MNPSCCLVLIKNEEYFLQYTLKQTEGYFDNYVIYDIGSTDNTLNIIDWWYEQNKHKTEIIIRKLPHCSPEVQGCFRNSMILEGKRDIYFILDGDEIYKSKALETISIYAKNLNAAHCINSQRRYGVFKRIEVNNELTYRYKETRSHHRLYTKDAYWTGTHPGERAGYKQCSSSEIYFDDITCFHLHNTIRSSKEADATCRIKRKSQSTYHPGNALIKFNLLNELPILRQPIADFKVSPALEKLQAEYNGNVS